MYSIAPKKNQMVSEIRVKKSGIYVARISVENEKLFFIVVIM